MNRKNIAILFLLLLIPISYSDIFDRSTLEEKFVDFETFMMLLDDVDTNITTCDNCSVTSSPVSITACNDCNVTNISIFNNGLTFNATYDALTPDTNASTACSGSTTYLDGEGTCDDIAPVYVDVTGDTMTGPLNITPTSDSTTTFQVNK